MRNRDPYRALYLDWIGILSVILPTTGKFGVRMLSGPEDLQGRQGLRSRGFRV